METPAFFSARNVALDISLFLKPGPLHPLQEKRSSSFSDYRNNFLFIFFMAHINLITIMFDGSARV